MSTFAVIVFGLLSLQAIHAQTSAFTYQGKLNSGGSPANAAFDMQFRLFDAESGGNQIETTQTIQNVQTLNGIFTVQLDFGSDAFAGAERWIDISISPAGQGTFVTLVPRQQINAAPYSVRALNAASATDSLNLGGVPANQYTLTNDSRLSDARVPLPGSNDYIQNSSDASQPGVSFNVGGTGSANILNAQTQLNLGGTRVLSSPGDGNLFAGQNAGSANTTGSNNAFFGRGAGAANTVGVANSFFGNNAGLRNTTGDNNTLVGDSTGQYITNGRLNTFVGALAGEYNSAGIGNSLFGVGAGSRITTGTFNSFVGFAAGSQNSGGNHNTFVGNETAFSDTNTAGSKNTLLGAYAAATDEINYATAIGAHATVTTSDTVVLGKPAGFYPGGNRPGDTVQIPGSLRVNGGNGVTVYGSSAGDNNVAHVAFQTSAGQQTGYVGDGSSADSNIFLTSLTGSVELMTNAGRILTADASGSILMRGGPNVLGPTVNHYAAQTIDTGNFKGLFTPNLFLSSLDTFSPSAVHICARLQTIGASGGHALTRCVASISPETSKTDVQEFSGGLDIVRRLNPLKFRWKADGRDAIGLNTEEVAQVAPQVITTNAEGKVDEVKEHSLNVIMISAIKEQQEQIEAQAEQIRRQKEQIDALRALVCQINPQATVCH